MTDARKLYRDFRGSEATRGTRIGVRFGRMWLTREGSSNILIPEELAVIGHVARIDYVTTRDGKAVRAQHEFAGGSRPKLAVGSSPGQLFLLGDRYQFTDRGIMDISPDGRLIEGKL